MNFNEYQRLAASAAAYPDGLGTATLPPGLYPALGLNGEAGEVAEKIKKFWRDKLSREDVRAAIIKELGDVLWYTSEVARCWDIELDEVAHTNLSKLASRRTRGVISGSGDER